MMWKCCAVAALLVTVLSAVGARVGAGTKDHDVTDVPASALVTMWRTGDRHGDMGTAKAVLDVMYANLQVVVPAALKGDMNDPREAALMMSALDVACMYRIGDALPIMVARLRDVPVGVHIAIGDMGNVGRFPFAAALVSIGRDSVPHIISYLHEKRQNPEAVSDEDIVLFAKVLWLIYDPNSTRECSAVLDSYAQSFHVERVRNVYRRLEQDGFHRQ